MGADAAIVQAATWTAVLAAGCLLIRLRGVLAAAAALAVVAWGVSYATVRGGHDPRPPAVSVDWPVSHPRHRSMGVTVHRGDCLWVIAARRLAHPSPTHVATAWPRWWTTNRHVIGADADLLRPGQRLRPPVAVRSRS